MKPSELKQLTEELTGDLDQAERLQVGFETGPGEFLGPEKAQAVQLARIGDMLGLLVLHLQKTNIKLGSIK